MGCCCSDQHESERSERSERSPITKVEGYSPSSKGERECLRVINKYLPNHTFVKARPLFLKNPQSGRCLELDIYCEELKLAIEYNGEQHYKYIPRYHKSREDFDQQRFRDDFKRAACKRYGITLITIRYDCPNIEVELVVQLRNYGFI